MLINAFNQNVIDFSHADIHELKSNAMSELELEKLLELQNEYSFDRFSLRMYQTQQLDELEAKIEQKQARVIEEHQKVQDQVHKTFEQIMQSDASSPSFRVPADAS